MSIFIVTCSENVTPVEAPHELKLSNLYGTIRGDSVHVYSDLLQDVEITLIDDDSLEYYSMSDESGEFIFDSLSIGEYRIEFVKEVPFNNYLFLSDSLSIIDSNDVIDTFYFSSFQDNYFLINSGLIMEYKGSESYWPAQGGEHIDSVTIRIEILDKIIKVGYNEYQASLEKTVFWKHLYFGYIGGQFVQDTSFYTNEVTYSSGSYIEKEGLVYNFFYPGFHAYPKGNEFFKQIFGCGSGFCFLNFTNGDPFLYKSEHYNTVKVDIDPSMYYKTYEYVKDLGIVTIYDLIQGNSNWLNKYVLVNHTGPE
jgi:hypothetical protein